MYPAEFRKLAARHNLVEIAEACRKESKYPQATVGGKRTLGTMVGIRNCYGSCLLLARPILQEYDAFTVAEIANNPASVQPVESVTARLLDRPILKEYDASTVD